ncbi:MAG: shikimate kinase [Clostridiales bacterium]|nr:shikimate kinase [Clostridiales bacterium]
MNKDNIVLIGMPGAGKSTLGVVLAKVLGYQFIDADLVIQEKENRLLKDIISQEGLEGFIQIENDVNASIETKHSVIATGGSVIYGKEAMEHLRQIGTIIYLKLSYRTISKRLGNIRQRGVVLKKGQDLAGLYEERCPLYEKYADIVVDCENMDLEETMETIVERILTIVE